tara:strand:+ start:379 stop:645 length:267 start_codon:yes stop_codon:yes gene_type:complete
MSEFDWGVEMPTNKMYAESNREYLDDIHEGLAPGDFRGQIKRYCEYLRIDIPNFKKSEMAALHGQLQRSFIAKLRHDMFVKYEIEADW